MIPGIIAGGFGASDPYWVNVGALMHMDGVDGGNSFPDVRGHTVAEFGSSTTVTANRQFGTAAANLPAAARLEITPSSGDFDLGTADFTVEAFLYIPSFSGTNRYAISFNGGANEAALAIIVNPTDQLRAFCRTSAPATIGDITSAGSFPVASWTHVAYVRSSGTFALYVGGTSVGTASSGSANRSTVNVLIGCNPAIGNDWTGLVDEFRVTMGVARYTANFTPPDAAFPNS